MFWAALTSRQSSFADFFFFFLNRNNLDLFSPFEFPSFPLYLILIGSSRRRHLAVVGVQESKSKVVGLPDFHLFLKMRVTSPASPAVQSPESHNFDLVTLHYRCLSHHTYNSRVSSFEPTNIYFRMANCNFLYAVDTNAVSLFYTYAALLCAVLSTRLSH
mmetsp:Transcript_21111/g.34824  ORF Transcript_21111/g.34824 Transcript_21111/m.34824 type:complete len:160 (+) Transcript_21111:138-617(+)